MKIKYEGSGRTQTTLRDFLSEWFYIGRYEWDDADYGFSIILFGREWNWLIYKDKESFFEYQQLAYDYEARYLKWQYDNGQEVDK
jgi:hypothetical protein